MADTHSHRLCNCDSNINHEGFGRLNFPQAKLHSIWIYGKFRKLTITVLLIYKCQLLIYKCVHAVHA